MTVTVAISDENWSEPPRMRLNVTATGVLGADISITRTHVVDGGTYPVLLEGGSRVISGTWVGYDYHAPFQTDVQYTVLVAGQSPVTSAVGYLYAERHWLMHSTSPALSVAVNPVEKAYGDQSFESGASLFRIIGSRTPISITDGARPAETSELMLKLRTADEKRALELLLESDGPVLFSRPQTDGWEPTWIWIQPGSLTLSNPAWYSHFPYRLARFSYAQVEQPTASSQALWRCDDVTAEFASCTAVLSTFVTNIGLLTNSRGA